MQDMLNTKKFGDIAFRDKDFKSAIEYYSKVNALFPSPFSLSIAYLLKSRCLQNQLLICSIFWLCMSFFNDNKVHSFVYAMHRVHKYILFTVFKG